MQSVLPKGGLGYAPSAMVGAGRKIDLHEAHSMLTQLIILHVML